MAPTYVLVHGSAGSAQSWTALQQEMALRGHRTIAVDLPGRGAGFSRAYHEQDLETFAKEPSPIAGVTAADMIGHVLGVVRRVHEYGPVVLVAHSFGGLVTTGVANAAPELLSGLVYIAAQCPVDRAPGEYPRLPEWADSALFPATAPLLAGDPAVIGCLRLNWRGADRAQITALREAITGELTDEAFLRALTVMQPDEVLWLDDPEWDHRVDKDTWGRVPHTYIRLTEDRAMPPAAQDLYIKEADALTPENPFEVHSLASSHGGFLRQAGEAADILARLG
ncbi:alpha/beta fold hydrolase [Amycolatopsis sp. NPDC058986]|uniref:alpha/beta fold hydrolase n=1 Tax=unclassified Amycolatopsis TaxID=2618356 RepID=UPI00366AD62B